MSEVARARPKATQGPSTGRGAVGPAQSRGHLLVKPCSDPDFWLLCPTCTVRARATRAKVGFWGQRCTAVGPSCLLLHLKVIFVYIGLMILSLPLLVIHFLSKPVQIKCAIVKGGMNRPQRTKLPFNFFLIVVVCDLLTELSLAYTYPPFLAGCLTVAPSEARLCKCSRSNKSITVHADRFSPATTCSAGKSDTLTVRGPGKKTLEKEF